MWFGSLVLNPVCRKLICNMHWFMLCPLPWVPIGKDMEKTQRYCEGRLSGDQPILGNSLSQVWKIHGLLIKHALFTHACVHCGWLLVLYGGHCWSLRTIAIPREEEGKQSPQIRKCLYWMDEILAWVVQRWVQRKVTSLVITLLYLVQRTKPFILGTRWP